MNAARHAWRTWLSRRVLIRPEDQVTLRLAERMTEDLLNDKPNATAAEVALVRNLALAQVALGLCLAEVGTEGAFHVNADGQRVASAGLREVGKFMSEVRQGLVALGLDRRAAPTTTLDAYLSALKSGAATSVDAIPVEAVTVGESKS